MNFFFPLFTKAGVVEMCSMSLQNGFSILNSASLKGYTEIVDLLVRAGADIHLGSSDVSNTL